MRWLKPFCIVFLAVLFSCGAKDKVVFQDFQTLQGKQITVQELNSKVVVINLWATWCGPCVHEINSLNALEKRYQNNDKVVFLAISNEKTSRIQRFLSKKQFTYQQIANNTFFETLQTGLVSSIPKHYVIDQNQNVVLFVDGAPDDIQEQLASAIDQAL